VRNLRVSLDLTQKVFSRVLGVSKKTIEKWEQGVNPVKGPSARLLYLISENHNLVNDLYRVNIVDNFSLDSNEYYSIKQVTPLISETSNMMYKVSTKEENYDKSHDTDNFIVEGGIPCQQSSNHQLLSS
jgi:transcriptional regulator with XRE-family HTH domain